MTVSHLFDGAGREISLWNVSPAGVGLAIFSASYDTVGNRTSVQELDGTRVTYGYDPSYQLVNEQRSGANAYNTTYLYDGVGNRTLKNDSGQLTGYLYNAADELTLLTPPTGQPTTSAWDANGNLLSENAGGSLTTYSWDGENRLTGVAYPTGAPDTFSYSIDGLRQRKATSAGVVEFVWDEQNVLLETDGSGATQAHYTDYPGMWGGLASQRRGALSSFYGFDQQASTRVLVTAGVVSDSYLYKAFGEELLVTGSAVNPLRFGGMVGYYRDLATRLYVRARQYQPLLGRWASGRLTLRRRRENQYVLRRPLLLLKPAPGMLRSPRRRLPYGSSDCNCSTVRSALRQSGLDQQVLTCPLCCNTKRAESKLRCTVPHVFPDKWCNITATYTMCLGDKFLCLGKYTSLGYRYDRHQELPDDCEADPRVSYNCFLWSP